MNVPLNAVTRIINKASEYSRLLITNDEMFDDLVKANWDEHKTFKIIFPSDSIVPNNLKRHFVRGYFDGDGAFNKTADNHNLPYCIKICGTREMLEGIESHYNI